MKSLHNFNGKGKSLFLVIMMAALLAPARMMGQETLTIYADGGDTQKAFIPFYGNYVNYYQKNEFIIPASKIVTMEDGVISKMTFYCTYSSSFDFACTFQVFMKEVSQSEFSNTSFLGTSGASVVYEGPLSRTSGPLEIDFTNNYTYHGGNLLIGFYVTEPASNNTTNYFYGETVTNSSLHGRNASSLDNITSGEHENFLPMVTFEYTSADCVRPHYLEAKNVSSSAALLIWEPGSVDQDLWEIYYTTTANDVPDENTTATISNITSPRCLIQGLTENTKYYVYVRAVCGGEDGNSRWSDVCSFTAKDTYNLTICDGTATSQYVPFNYYNQHQYQKCEYIIPASKIGVMNGSVISAMTIYDGTSGTGYTSATFTIWLKEVDIETFSSSSFIGTDDATQVYQGRLQKISGSGGLWTVTFTNPYLYSGGNLLVCVYLTAPTSSQSNKNFKGEYQSGTVALYRSASGSIDNITTGTTSTFLPKTKFEYSLPCPMPSDLTVAALSPHTATLTWNEGFLESAWEIMVNDDDQNLISVEGAPTYTLTGLDAETTYSVKVRATCGGDDGNSAWTDAVDFTTLVACPMPTRFRLSNLGQHTATLNWTPGRDETSWLLAWSTDSDFNPNEATPIQITGTPACAFSDLTPETNYYVYLRGDCDEEGNSLWTDKFTFRTALYNPTLLNDDNPYYYDGFDGETLEWEMANGGNHWMQGRSTCVSAPYAMYLSVSHSFIIDLSIATKSYVYKTFELEGGKQYEVSFDWRCKPLHNSTDFFEFRIYPAGVIFEAGEYPTGASAILSRRLEGSNKYLWDDHYETFQIPEGEGGSYVVVFSWKSDQYGSGGYYYDNSAAFDNFLINVYQGEAPRPTPPQPEPTEVTLPMEVLEVTPLAWQIIYSTDPELDPYTLDLSEFPDNLPEGVLGVETTETVPTLQGLDPETGYYVYVRAIYPPIKKDEEERVFSRWSEQITFTTAVSCFSVEDLEATTVAADNATLAWNTDDQQPSANAPATWNVRYKKDVQAGTTTNYTFNDGKNPAAYVENWSVKNGSLISAGYTDNNCIGFEIQLPCVVSFDAEGISADVNYEVKACYDPQGNSVMASMNGTAVDGVSQPATFDFSDYGGTCYLVFSMSYQAPLLIDNLTLDVPVWITGMANSNTFTINGLETQTDYLFAVQAHCGEGDDSQWVPASFRTAYGNMAIPYEEDFDGYSEGDLPEGWCSINNDQFPMIMDDNEITPHSSENCLVLFGSDESDQYAILSPAENVSSLQMAFWSATPVSQFGQTTFTIGVMTDPEDATTFAPVKTFTTTSDWTKNVVYFDQYEGQGQYIAIQLVGAAKLVAIDDIEISEAPSCFLPEALTVTDLTTSSAVVSWTPNGEETQWNICIMDMSSIEPDWGQPILVENTPSYTFDNLSLGTSYKVRVQAVCAVDDVSDWVETQFNTSFCEPENQCAITYTLEDEYGDGWNGASIDIMKGSTLVASLTIDGGSTYEGSLSLCPDVTYTFAWTSGEYDSECSFTIYDTEGTELLHHDVYSEFEETTLLQYDMVCPSCITPSGLAVTEHTVSSAAFSWMASSGVSAWEYEYSSDNEHWSQTQVVEGTPSCVLEGLMPSSSYYFRVRANCGEDDYSKWATLEFNTDCGTINVDAEHPYSENFDAIKGWGYYDNAEHNILPRCWSYINTSENFYGYPSLFGEHPYYYNEGGEGGDGGYYEEGECNHSYSCPTYMRFVASNGACEQYAILPAMSNVNGLQLKFMVHNADFDLYNETVLHIGVMTDPTDASTYTEIQSYLLTIPVYEELCVYFDKYELQPNVDEYYIAFKVDVPEDGMYDIYIDNVSVTVLPSCLAPYELSVGNVGENDATLTWAPNGDETAWQVRYSSDKVNWTIVDYTEAEPGQTVTELLDNLTHNTLYYVQVRANCGGSYSDWSRQNKFRTDCSSGYQDVPFFEDFDSYIALDDRMPQCWTYINASNSTQYPTNQSYPVISNGVEGYTANHYMYFLIKYYDYLNYHYGMDPQDQYVILPRMENIGNLQMKFSGLGEKNNYWTDFNCQVKVGVFDDNDAFHLIRTVETSRTGYFGNYLVTFDGYEGSGRIAFLVETPQQFGGRYYSSLVKIDNVSVTPKVSYKKFIADGNWSDASCWENGEMPTSASDNVLISAAAVIPSDCVAVCGIIEFDGNGANITIEDGGQLKHNNSGVHATMKKHIDPYTEGERDQWNLIAMPVVDEVYFYDVENINSGAYDLYYFDQTYEGAEWRNQENYEANWYDLTPKKGYLYANAEEVTLEVDGELFPANADQSVSLDYVEGKSRTGWNLIGNPFACQAYLANGMAYYRMNVGGTAIESAMAGTAIAPMEGVFVKASGSGQTAVFTTTQQRSDGHLNIRLSHNQGRAIDNAIMGFGEGGSLLKVQLMSNASKIYFSENDKDYSIISAGQIGEQPLNFTTSEDGNYTLTFSLAEVRLSYLHLIDNMTGADVDLLALRQAQGPATYTFSARSTDYESRFKLVFATIGDVDGDDDFAFFSNDNWVVVNEGEAVVQVIDMNGRILSSETINGSAQVKVNAACGLYVMRLVNGEKVKTQKIVVQ